VLERIGNCRVLEEVASGGMAVVYRAIQDGLGRTVAIKALKSSVAMDAQLVKRFEREAQSLAALAHENIIHVYDFHEEQGELFMVMEYVQGIDLYDLLDSAGRLPTDCGAIVAMQTARALDYIHYQGIVHRDIKPANIMISRQGGVKLMDFGIARDHTFDDDLTQTGTGIGTPSYMSPEQIKGDADIDGRSDLFAAGLILQDTYFESWDDDRKCPVTIKDLIMPLEVILVPIFFVLMGLQVKLETFMQQDVMILAAGLLVAAIIGKVLSGLGAFGVKGRIAIGIGMMPRGEVGLIFAAIGKSLGVLDDALFSAVVIMAIPHVVYMAFFIIAMGGLLINYPSINNLEKAIPLSSSEAQGFRK